MDKDIESISNILNNDPEKKPEKKKKSGFVKWTRRIVLFIFITIVSIIIALQLPVVQTWLAHQTTKWLFKEYGVLIQIDKVKINFWDEQIYLNKVLVNDHKRDTLINADIIKIDIDHIYTDTKIISLERIVLQGGYFNLYTYKGEKSANLNQFIKAFQKGEKKKKKEGGAWQLKFSTIILDECKLRICNENSKVLNADFIPSNIRISDISGKVSDFSIRSDTIEMNVEGLSAIEASKLALNEFSSKVLICNHELTFSNLHLKTYKSYLNGYFSMRYNNWGAFSHFNDSVKIIADLDLSDINASDIAFFTNNLKGLDFNFRFRGGLVGTLSDFKANGFSIYFGNVSQLVGDLQMKGLPNIDSTYIDFKVKKLTTNNNDLNTIPIPPFKDKKLLTVPSQLSTLGVIKYKGEFRGYFNDMHIDGNAETKIGSGDIDMHLYRPTKNSPYAYSGRTDISLFDLGKFTGNQKQLGRVSLSIDLSGKGFDLKNGSTNLKGNVKQFEFNGYNYHNITADASFGGNQFEGKLKINDPNVVLDFLGKIDVSNKDVPKFNFHADVQKMNLPKLGLVKTDSIAIIGTKADVNFTGKNIDEIVGFIDLENTNYQYGNKMYHIDELHLKSEMQDTNKTITLSSDYADAKFSGYFKFIPLVNELKKLIYNVAPSSGVKPNDKINYSPQDFYFYTVFKNPDPLTDIIAPDLKISKGTTIEGKIDNKKNNIYVEINADKVKYKQFVINDWYFIARNKGKKFRAQSSANQFFLTDSVKIDNLNLNATALNDSVDLWIGFQNEKSKLNGASVNLMAYFGKAPNYEFNIHESYFYFDDSLWTVNNENKIILDSNALTIHNLSLKTKSVTEPILFIEGKSSKSMNDSIRIDFNHFPIAIVNTFLPKGKLALKGDINGVVSAQNILKSPILTSDLNVNQFELNELPLGDLGLDVSFDNKNQIFTINSLLNNNGVEILKVQNGKYNLKDKENQFDILAKLNGLDLVILDKLLYPTFTNFKGFAYGAFSVTGNAEKPLINSSINLKDAGFRIAYLNAYFNFQMAENVININNRTIKIPMMDMTDRYGNKGTVKGKVSHNLFKDIFLDITMNANNMCVLETGEKDNDRFYGKAYVSGKATIIGPLNDIIVAANLTSEKNTILNIPIGNSKSVNENNFITFINKKDTTSKKVEEPKGNFTIDLNVKATPTAIVRIIFDEKVGDVITAQGSSENINLTLDTKGKFSMVGTYEITKGDYLFTLQNLINKQFTVKPGSSITFTGNPYNAILNATAVYRANASLYPIVSAFMDPTTAENYRRATKIDCELTLTNTLANMLIEFNLSLPNTDANTTSMVKSTINTADEMNRQVFALLVLNQFLPPESTGGSGGGGASMISTGLGTSSLELLSGQLNNWLGKLTKDVNINLKYKAGDASNTDQVSVALSTQFFNERLVIDGDVGVGGQRITNNSTSGNQIVGNVSVEVKVTKDGKLRVRAFNRSNDNNLLKNSSPYTQGAGVTYRREFDSWKDLFKKKKKKEKKEK